MRTTSSQHSKNPVMSPLINSTSLWSKYLIICKFEKSHLLSCYISLNVKIWGVLTVLHTECQTVPALPFKWCKYDFSGWDPNSSCWKQLNSTDATVEFITCFHHQVTLPIRKQTMYRKLHCMKKCLGVNIQYILIQHLFMVIVFANKTHSSFCKTHEQRQFLFNINQSMWCILSNCH